MPQLCTNYFEISICKKDAYSNQFDLFRHKQILKFTYNWWFHTTDPRRNEVYGWIGIQSKRAEKNIVASGEINYREVPPQFACNGSWREFIL